MLRTEQSVEKKDPRIGIAAARRKPVILEAAMAVIAKHGLSATTMERVAKAAGVSPGTVSFHFSSKDRLLLETLDAVALEFELGRRAAVDSSGGDPVRALLALIDTNLGSKLSDPRKVAVWHAFWGEAKPRRVYLERVGAFDDAYHASLEKLFRRVIAQGGYDHLDAEAVTYGFAGLLEALWQEILTDGRRFDRSRARRLARNYLAGLFPRHFQREGSESTPQNRQGEQS
ncbi:MAG: TetR family transcriptional regulator [Rhodovibrionaceae bacterium]